VRKAMAHDKISEQEYFTFWESGVKDFIWLPSKKRYERNASATNTERLQSIQVRSCFCTEFVHFALILPYKKLSVLCLLPPPPPGGAPACHLLEAPMCTS
jgi:hypothetical protein